MGSVYEGAFILSGVVRFLHVVIPNSLIRLFRLLLAITVIYFMIVTLLIYLFWLFRCNQSDNFVECPLFYVSVIHLFLLSVAYVLFFFQTGVFCLWF